MSRSKVTTLSLGIFAIFLFWTIRLWYWTHTYELPFSDMGDLDYIAKGILNSFKFDFNSYWKTYAVPTVSTLRAIQTLILGDSLFAWEVFQGVLLCSGLIWLGFEIKRLTNSKVLPLVLLFTVALSKSSVFWSLKLAREGAAEALMYLTIAALLAAMRTRNSSRSRQSKIYFFFAGLLTTASFLNRSNALFVFPAMIAVWCMPIVLHKVFKRHALGSLAVSKLSIALYVAGVFTLWTPWMVRSYMLYSTVVPLSIQAPYSFLWELGGIKVTLPDGTHVETDVNQLQNTAPATFKNDLEASPYANTIVKEWIRENKRYYLKLIGTRLLNSATDRTIYLTKVSRENLLPGFWNKLLIDKNWLTMLFGIVGLIVLTCVYPPLIALSIIAFLPWLTGVFFLAEPRMLEPSVPLFLFGCVGIIGLGVRKLFTFGPASISPGVSPIVVDSLMENQQRFAAYFEVDNSQRNILATIYSWDALGVSKNPAFIQIPYPLTRDHPHRILLPAFGEGISTISFLVGTYARINSSSITLKIKCLGQVVREIKMSSALAEDNKLLEFHFEPITEIFGLDLFCELSSDANDSNCIALWGNEVNSQTFPQLFEQHIAEPESEFMVYRRRVSRLETRIALSSQEEALRDQSFLPLVRGSSSGAGEYAHVFKWEDPAELYPAPVLPDMPVTLGFLSPLDSLDEIQINTATYGRVNNCRLQITLSLKGSNEPLRTFLGTGESVPNNGYFHFSFEPIENIRGKDLLIKVSSDDSSPNECIAVWGSIVHKAKLLKSPPIVTSSFDPETYLRKFRSSLPLTASSQMKLLLVTDRSADILEDRTVRQFLERCDSDKSDIIVRSSHNPDLLNEAAGAAIILIYSCATSPQISALIEIARHGLIPMIGLDDLADEAVEVDDEVGRVMDLRFPLTKVLPAIKTSDNTIQEFLRPIKNEYLVRRFPKFSIISVLYGKENQLADYLRSIYRQHYQGEIEIIFVDDCSPDRSVMVAQDFTKGLASNTFTNISMKIVRNETNIGNCGSRNRGLSEASGDILLIIDADCLLNETFLRAHADTYYSEAADIVIGPFNIETHGQEPRQILSDLENDPARVKRETELQDPINREGFLNCITRNFSISKAALEEITFQNGGGFFDELFSYSANPLSGFGWEDVEMGYRVYCSGKKIRFTDQAYTIHISHPPSMDDKTKPIRSLLNFRRLLEKHPEIIILGRRWTLETYQKIRDWCDVREVPINEDRIWVDENVKRFQPYRMVTKAPFSIAKQRKKILTYRWHVPHQAELYKLPHDFTLVYGIAPGFSNVWNYEERPLPANASFKHKDEIDFRDYDLAILHFDENVLSPENSNGVLGPEWGDQFKWFFENVPLPKVAICHGTPQFYGQYNPEYVGDDLGVVIPEEITKFRDYLGQTRVICNSHQAQREWGFRNSQVIWQGQDPSEFGTTSYERGILTLGGMMKSRPVYRGYYLYQNVMKQLDPNFKPESIKVINPDASYSRHTNRYAVKKFNSYRETIQKYSVYFNPTLRSPMPRSRGEAMMCGLTTVSANNHDVQMFIKNGHNGFYSNDAAELAEYLNFTMRNPAAAKAIGLRGRQTAIDVFNHDRYLQEWIGLIDQVANG